MLRALLVCAGLLCAGPASAADPKVADLVRQLETGSAGERVIAAEHLRDLGPAASDGIPALTGAARGAHERLDGGSTESRRANYHLYHAACDALVSIGPKSAPALVELLAEAKEARFNRVASDLISFGRDAAPAAPALAKLLAVDDKEFQTRVTRILESIGPGAEVAIPGLVALFNTPGADVVPEKTPGQGPTPRVASVRALVRIGPKAVPAINEKVIPVLAEELKSDELSPDKSISVLKELGEAGAPLVPAVVASIRGAKHRLDRERWATALLGLGTTGRKAFDELLANGPPKVRRDLIWAIRLFCGDSGSRLHSLSHYQLDSPTLDIKPFMPALTAALKGPTLELRLTAAMLLCDYPDEVTASTRDALLAMLRAPATRKFIERDRWWFLLEVRPERFDKPGFDTLVALLDTDSVAVRKFAVKHLRGQRQWSAGALPRLRKLADYPDIVLALDAIEAAALLSLDPKDVAPLTAQRFLKHTDREVRARTARIFEELGPLAAAHLDPLAPLLDDKAPEVVQATARAIFRNAPRGSAAARALADRKLVPDKYEQFAPAKATTSAVISVPELVKALQAGEDTQRVEAALDLGDRGTAAKEAAPVLKTLFTDPDPDLRFAARYALTRIEQDGPALRNLLTAELERAAGGRPASQVVVDALGRLPPDYPELIPLILKGRKQLGIYATLLAVFEKHGPRAKAAVPALRSMIPSTKNPSDRPYLYLYWSGQQSICRALAAIGPDAREALPELRELLDTGNVESALAARDAIQKITGEKRPEK